MTHDLQRQRLTAGLGFALAAAASFGLSGTLAKGLLDVGWSAGAATLVRVSIAAAVLLVPAILAVRGRIHVVRSGWKIIVAYGLFAVAGAQLFYFLAVGYLDVSVALLIEYTAPVAVVVWLWLRHGHRPTPLTVAGAAVAAFGLALLLNVFGGGHQISLVGVLWALGAMVGASVYFIIGGDESNGLPPITLAGGGLVVAVVVLGIAGLVGILPMRFSTGTVSFVHFDAPWWVIALALGVVTAAIAYVTGIAATRRLGARLGSFVALIEVLAATGFAWLLLGQAPAAMQAGGALLILAGVIVVKLGERSAPTVIESVVDPPAHSDPPAPVPV